MAKTTTKNMGIMSETAYINTVDSIAELTVLRDKKQAKLDNAILEAREKYGEDITELNNQIASKIAQAEAYAQRNRGTLLSGDAKSAETAKARWGFRLGNPALVLLSKKHTWKIVGQKLIELGKTAYLKLSDPKPDKDKIKADMNDEELAALGLRIEQTESFWIEPKTDTAERINA